MKPGIVLRMEDFEGSLSDLVLEEVQAEVMEVTLPDTSVLSSDNLVIDECEPGVADPAVAMATKGVTNKRETEGNPRHCVQGTEGWAASY